MSQINYKQEYINSLLSYISYANMNGSEDGKWSDLLNKDLILNADV